jgi:glycerate 2-kinase
MSIEVARRMFAAVHDLKPEDLVVSLMSGGGPSLLIAPAGGMTIADKKEVNRALLLSGATISEMNSIRRKVSLINGGCLAQAAYPAKVVTLAISDVPGDDPADIASGPTVEGSGADERDGIWAIAGDTAGIDGSGDAAGAFVKPATICQMKESE